MKIYAFYYNKLSREAWQRLLPLRSTAGPLPWGVKRRVHCVVT